MTHSSRRRPSSLLTAMFCAAAVTAQFISGKATRDALFLTSLDYSALPAMLIATSACSLLLVAANAKGARTMSPSVLVPFSFVVSGLLFLVEWALRSSFPATAAIVVYVHVSGAGPLLASGFWLISTERFDPRTAKKRFGQIAGAGTLGGLLGAFLAERVAALVGAPAMLPLLAAINFASAWLVRRLAVGSGVNGEPAIDALPEMPSRSGLRVVAETPYLRHLGALVLLGTTSAALVDYLFKAQAVQTFGRGDQLLRFFAMYYAATSLVAFILQASWSRAALERFGLAATASTPSGALLLGSLGSLIAPGFGSLALARGGESVFRSSLFKTGYELFYTPMPPAERRAAKLLIDVAFDRLGDAIGGGLVHIAVLAAPAAHMPAILAAAIVCSAGAMISASRLNRGYLGSLEHSLINRAGDIDLSDLEDEKMRALMQKLRSAAAQRRAETIRLTAASARNVRIKSDPTPDWMNDIVTLRSRDRGRVVDVLTRDEGLTAVLVPHVIPLLAWQPVADHATFALRKVAEEHAGQLIDALIDPNTDFSVRRRLAQVFSVCVSERAANGLLLGLEDPRFDVRSQAARSLAAVLEKNPQIQVDAERIFEVVLREVAVSRSVWEGRRLLEGFATESPLDAFVRDRAGASLAHIFTLLSLVLPREPLQIAFRSLHTTDAQLQGTALEYLEGVLPPRIRYRLWPFLERRPATRPGRPSDQALAELLRSNQSIMLNLEELRRRTIQHPLGSVV